MRYVVSYPRLSRITRRNGTLAYRRSCVVVERAAGFAAFAVPRRAGAAFAFAAAAGFRRAAGAEGRRALRAAAGAALRACGAAAAFAGLGGALGSGPCRCTSVKRI